VALSDIETIVIVMMENRSFDHMLGYLSLENILPVEGLRQDRAWQDTFRNSYSGQAYSLFKIAPHTTPPSDPQHDRRSIAMQIQTPPIGPGPTTMGGFVESYARFSDPVPHNPGAVMGFFDAQSVPVFDFFARNFCVCDHWFAPLPLGTQANRLMAMAGESLLLDNAGSFLPEQQLVYDWLTEHHITWCAYQAGDFLPFFSLMPTKLVEIASQLTLSQLGVDSHFRRYTRLRENWASADPLPQVIFVEPEYTDGPHLSPNDDHPPTGVGAGQRLLGELYGILTSNATRWAKTLLVVTYDEHGGFFDHVPPLSIPTTIAGLVLDTTGVRVPAFIVSPYVGKGSVFHGPLDHTSLLQLLHDRFLSGEGYSVAVNERQRHFDRIANTLTTSPRSGPPPALGPVLPDSAMLLQAQATPVLPSAPATPNARALHQAAERLAKDHPQLLAQPGWENLKAYLAETP
jgi:phospholipase C